MRDIGPPILVRRKTIAVVVELHNPNHASFIESWVLTHAKDYDSIVVVAGSHVIDCIRRDFLPSSVSYVSIWRRSEWRMTLEAVFFTLSVKPDLVSILTLQGNIFSACFFFLVNSPLAIAIHNCRTWLKGNNPSKPIHYIKQLVRWVWMLRATYVILTSERVREYARRNGKPELVFKVVPFSQRRSKFAYMGGQKLTVVVPGAVSTYRRNYVNMTKLAELHPEIEFVLLGKVNEAEGGAEVITDLVDRGLSNVVFFNEYVSPVEFDYWMCRSIVMLVDLNTSYGNSDIVEVYGLSKDSGVSFLMKEYGVPAFINSDFVNHTSLAEMSHYFSDFDSLMHLFSDLSSEASVVRKCRTDGASIVLEFGKTNIASVDLSRFQDMSTCI